MQGVQGPLQGTGPKGGGEEKEMKIKCPADVYCSDCSNFYECEKGNIEVEIPTADLIAELGKRRPCDNCFNAKKSEYATLCLGCLYSGVFTDNFKAK